MLTKRKRTILLSLAIIWLAGLAGLGLWKVAAPSGVEGTWCQKPTRENWHVEIAADGVCRRFEKGKLVATGSWRPVHAWERRFPSGVYQTGDRRFYSSAEVEASPAIQELKEAGQLEARPQAYELNIDGRTHLLVAGHSTDYPTYLDIDPPYPAYIEHYWERPMPWLSWFRLRIREGQSLPRWPVGDY